MNSSSPASSAGRLAFTGELFHLYRAKTFEHPFGSLGSLRTSPFDKFTLSFIEVLRAVVHSCASLTLAINHVIVVIVNLISPRLEREPQTMAIQISDSACERAHRLYNTLAGCGNDLVPESWQWLRDHLNSCEKCRALIQLPSYKI